MLIKIGQAGHIEALQKRGFIYCNTIQYFRDLELKEQERKDNREGATASIKVENLKLFIGEERKEIPIRITKARMHPYDRENLQTHLFCLFCIKKENVTGKPFIDPRNVNFGDKALIILDKNEFLQRFKKATHGKLNYSYGLVRYYDEEQSHEKLTVHDKPDRFAYQSEFRFHIKEASDGPLTFEIGSIEDISKIIDATLLPELFLQEN